MGEEHAQCGYAGQRDDSRSVWDGAGQHEMSFITLLRMVFNLKPRNCLVLELSM